ncbi:MAG: hypothetical protein WA949_19185 [Phormidesmis sp.]
MPKPTILQLDQNYMFLSYFEMAYEPDDILAAFGCSLEKVTFDFPELDASGIEMIINGLAAAIEVGNACICV